MGSIGGIFEISDTAMTAAAERNYSRLPRGEMWRKKNKKKNKNTPLAFDKTSNKNSNSMQINFIPGARCPRSPVVAVLFLRAGPDAAVHGNGNGGRLVRARI